MAVICSDGRGGRSQGIRMRSVGCQRPLETEEIHFPSTYRAGRVLQDGAGARSLSESAEFTVLKRRPFPPQCIQKQTPQKQHQRRFLFHFEGLFLISQTSQRLSCFPHWMRNRKPIKQVLQVFGIKAAVRSTKRCRVGL